MPGLDAFRILIIEEDLTFRRTLYKVLNGAGYSVFAAADLVEAREFLTQSRFALILYGLRRPYQGGLDELRQLLGAAGDCKIVVITTFSEAALKKQVLKMGASQLMVKPFRKAALLKAVSQLTAKDS